MNPILVSLLVMLVIGGMMLCGAGDGESNSSVRVWEAGPAEMAVPPADWREPPSQDETKVAAMAVLICEG